MRINAPLLLLAGLTACATGDPAAPPNGSLPMAPAPAVSSPEPSSGDEPKRIVWVRDPKADPDTGGERTAAPGRPKPIAPAPAPTEAARTTPEIAPPFDPEAAVGAAPAGLHSRLGEADEVRPEPPGLVWVYRGQGCAVEFYLYPNVDTGSFSVLGHKVLPASLSASDRATCFRQLGARDGRS